MGTLAEARLLGTSLPSPKTKGVQGLGLTLPAGEFMNIEVKLEFYAAESLATIKLEAGVQECLSFATAFVKRPARLNAVLSIIGPLSPWSLPCLLRLYLGVCTQSEHESATGLTFHGRCQQIPGTLSLNP